MTKTREIYRCPICGNIVEVLHEGAVLSCCGKPMELLKGCLLYTSDAADD